MANINGQLFEDFQVFTDRPGGGKLPGRQVGAETPAGLYYRGQTFMKGDRVVPDHLRGPDGGGSLFERMVSSFRILPPVTQTGTAL